MAIRTNAIECMVVCDPARAIERLTAGGMTSQERVYCEFLLTKLRGKIDRYINPRWRIDGLKKCR